MNGPASSVRGSSPSRAAAATRRPGAGGPAAGFTLIELVVVMGILTGFLVMLVQFVGQGVELFDEGESGQAMADRADAARTAVTRELRALSADGRRIEPGVPDDRLLLQRFALGLPARPLPTDPQGFLLRAGIRLDPLAEERLVAASAGVRAAVELGVDADPEQLAARTAALVAETPLRSRGRLLLAQFPQTVEGDPPGAALVELRVGHFLLDQRLPVDDALVDPFEVPFPGGNELPAVVLYEATTPLVRDLLYVDVAMWAQDTEGWGEAIDGEGSDGGRGPQRVWDSARAGLLSDPAYGPVFALDVGPQSLADPTDDVHPHALRVTLVLAAPEDGPREGLLADRLPADGQALRLVDGDRFPGADDGGYVKVATEWIRYSERRGDTLRGLRRGQRGTKARQHDASAVVRFGRTVEFTIPLQHGKDDWSRNG